MRNIGRPMKYDKLLRKLDPEDLYSPATIARFAQDHRWIPPDLSLQEARNAKLRIRVALGRFSNNHQFPDEGDGLITLRGQAPVPAWFGWRWQKPLH